VNKIVPASNQTQEFSPGLGRSVESGAFWDLAQPGRCWL